MNRLEEHDSWIAVDPLEGCVASCAYCYLNGLGLTGVRPTQRHDLNALLGEMGAADRVVPGDVPFCFGNRTDLCMTAEGRELLVRLLEHSAGLDRPRPLVVITKARLGTPYVRRLADAAGGRLVVLLSQSFAPRLRGRVEKGPTSSPTETYRSMEVVAATPGVRGLHFWRPFMATWNPRPSFDGRLRRLMDSGSSCSIVVGLKGERPRGLRLTTESACPGEEWLDTRLVSLLLSRAEAHRYPLYRHTTCGIAFATKSPEILGTMRSVQRTAKCEAASCPPEQRRRCASDRLRTLTVDEAFERVRSRLGGIPDGLHIDERGAQFTGVVDEFVYNSVMHVLHCAPGAATIVTQKAWLGSMAASAGDIP